MPLHGRAGAHPEGDQAGRHLPLGTLHQAGEGFRKRGRQRVPEGVGSTHRLHPTGVGLLPRRRGEGGVRLPRIHSHQVRLLRGRDEALHHLGDGGQVRPQQEDRPPDRADQGGAQQRSLAHKNKKKK